MKETNYRKKYNTKYLIYIAKRSHRRTNEYITSSLLYSFREIHFERTVSLVERLVLSLLGEVPLSVLYLLQIRSTTNQIKLHISALQERHRDRLSLRIYSGNT